MVTLALVLKKNRREPADISRAIEISRSLGLERTAQGRATISVRISDELFRRFFNVRLDKVMPHPPGERDAGAPPGLSVQEQLRVPTELRDFIDSISIVPPARRL